MRAAQRTSAPARNGEPRSTPAPITFGPFSFDPKSRLLRRDGREVPLPPRVLGVLELLLDRAGEVVGRQELIDTIWKDAFVTDTSLAEAVSVLRQSLGDDPQSPTFIQTLHRRGYRFVAPVGSATGAPPPVEADEALAAQPVSPSIGKELVPWGAAAIFACIAAASLWQLTRSDRIEPAITTRFAVAAAAGTAFDADAPALALSRDGTRIAWSACDTSSSPERGIGRCRLFVRSLDRIDAVAIAGVEGHAPFFSPDGRWLAFFSGGRLMKVALAGGAPTTIADAPTALGGVWTDREIIFAGSPSGGLQRVSANGGEARPLTMPREEAGEIRHVWPAIVPGTRVLVFTIDTNFRDADASSPGVLAALSLDTLDQNGQARGWRTLLAGASIARAAASDAIVFARDADLHAVAFDPIRMAISGTPRAIAGNLATARGRGQFALSPTGTLVYAEDSGSHGGVAVILGRNGTASSSLTGAYREAALSPDGLRVAGVKIEDTRADIWITDAERGAATRLTHTGTNTSPVWSADGRVLYFASRTNGAFELWKREADGSGNAVRIFESTRHAFPLASSPDGALIAFAQTSERTRTDIWVLPQSGPARAIVQGPFDEGAASFSPDSSMLAFESAESGRWEIYVLRVRDGRRTLVSTDGGRVPLWMHDGLYFQSGRELMRVTIDDEANELRVRDSSTAATIEGDLLGRAADGRMLVNLTSQPRVSGAIVSLDWLRDLRALLGPPVSDLPR
jgi:DNA-binding winged helix-turn-helix (wHTH) protein/Tol biopolymer transport system component